MKKNYLLLLMFLFACSIQGQMIMESRVVEDGKQNAAAKNRTGKSATTFGDIQYWVGSGSNKAAFVVQWNDGKNSDALIWGFRWDGNATGEDMLKAILKTDRRFFALLYKGTQTGSLTGGLGFDLNGIKTIGLYKGTDYTYPLYPTNGFVNTATYDFDNYTAIDANDHWQAGYTNGEWSYWTKNAADPDFGAVSTGASSRVLENGSWDVWNYAPSKIVQPIAGTFTPVTPYVEATDFTNGYFVVNEDWFGHTNGSANFINKDGSINYRIYSTANNNETFGVTTCYGTIYGDKIYFVSKQAASGGDQNFSPGGRLVVANAQNMKKIAGFANIGGGDGRSFVGVNENTGYIGTSKGIFLFDIANLKVGAVIAGTSSVGQIGNMIRTSQYVFVVSQNGGVLVIDPNNNTLVKTITGKFHSIAQAKDGSVWGIQDQKLININATSFTVTEYAIPTTKYLGSWGAWNAGSFTYSTQENALYWINAISSSTSGTKIVKFDIASKSFNENFATIPGQTDAFKQIPYGAALRIDPISDELILTTTENGFGAHYQKNWIHTFDTTGSLTQTKVLDDYYWFPAITVFPDKAAPVVSTTLPSEVSIKEPAVIDLKSIVSDADNLSSAIVKSIKSVSDTEIVSAIINVNDELVLTPKALGNAIVVIRFNSNGKLVEKSIIVNTTSTLGTGEFTKLELAVYPNPVSDVLNIRTEDEVLKVTVHDISGKSINAQISNNQINVSDFANGMYIINIVTDKANYVQKFIKK
ncbi:T9SS type A sorting domain-containing protein [Flavobacterium collinsii]|uniref:Secretion system C-terminal sorting domain-containing protein n=1 Tax=Flavobacterium collinsii TaxID=1114861 RepID=A0A9W4TJH1_9FLAO|nr:DUF5074 domain-containing protein [Flavobacterium collinsii]CAI2769181.1 conserved protein of unknown function precursor containing a type A C-terminal secretion signal [Flavobacterium collinsii]